jgi:hypothetical protein
MRSRIASAVLAGTLAVLLGQCALPSSASLPIMVYADTITLEWDPSPAASTYRLYYSQHDADRWYPLGELPGSEDPVFVVHHDYVGNGDFDFGVSAVNDLGIESRLHTSHDVTSSPVGGWHVRWVLSR